MQIVAGADSVRRAADVLNAGEKVAILIGQGAKHAVSEVEQIADLLGAGVAKALLGKAVLPDALPWVTGSIGLLGTRQRGRRPRLPPVPGHEVQLGLEPAPLAVEVGVHVGSRAMELEEAPGLHRVDST